MGDIFALQSRPVTPSIQLSEKAEPLLFVESESQDWWVKKLVQRWQAPEHQVFLHPTEAFHGDLGMVTPLDTLLAISNSGETDELLKIVPFLKQNGNKFISITGNSSSSLAVSSDIHIEVKVDSEACALDLAPTTSTTAVMAVGDALAVALMRTKNFTEVDFARFHPGGSLGRRLLATVGDYARTIDIPTVPATASFEVVLNEIMRGGLGVSLVDVGDGKGLVTDGDIRRAISIKQRDAFSLTALEVCSKNPVTVKSSDTLYNAEKIFLDLKITCLLVEFHDGQIGILKQEFLK